MKFLRRDPVKRAEALLAPMMPDLFKVDYYAAFPCADGTTVSFFQVVFAIGAGEDPEIRSQVLRLFEQMLVAVSQMKPVRKTQWVRLCARRRVPDHPHYREDHPFMFIEAQWRGSEVAAMYKQGDFADWARRCHQYINRFDEHDPLTRVS